MSVVRPGAFALRRHEPGGSDAAGHRRRRRPCQLEHVGGNIARLQTSTANKLLVLVDGRTVYSPLFSGTFWDVQELLFADVDRIEVIRGPGGSLWGANAVNGVVNVIMKPASRHAAFIRW